MIMFNPQITAKSGEYETEEGCLSLAGVRKTKRYRKITVAYQDQAFHSRTGSFEGFTAQIIQYEIDHCDGILSDLRTKKQNPHSSPMRSFLKRCKR